MSSITKATLSLLFFCLFPFFANASGQEAGNNLIEHVGIAIFSAAVLAFVAHSFKQPLLLAYLITGVLVGPIMGFGIISEGSQIETISHYGLILLLFLIGLEIDFKKLKESGKSLFLTGLLQFPISVLLGLGFFQLISAWLPAQGYNHLYLSVGMALSSTAIVVKLLYGKFELGTMAGRITLGVLVFQDIWAIIVLGIQPNLENPEIAQIAFSFVKGGFLVLLAVGGAKYLLPKIFHSIAKIPELLLLISLGWCFLVCGLADALGLSVEMGALIAGASIASFPYNLDVVAKVVNLRDFFVTLFFVSLGMQIPNPLDQPSMLLWAFALSLFLLFSRFLSVWPVLHFLKNGNRVSILPAINLAQMSEFSLVIAALGVGFGHIDRSVLSIIIFIFVFTSIGATYLIKGNDVLQKSISKALSWLGIKEIHRKKEEENKDGKDVVILGFHHHASSLLAEFLEVEDEADASIKERLLVVDFNPVVLQKLKDQGIAATYGDISHLDTLHHAGISKAKVVISSIPDSILVGTSNRKILQHLKHLCKDAHVVVHAENLDEAKKLYNEGADYVFVSRFYASEKLKRFSKIILEDNDKEYLDFTLKEKERLFGRMEILD
jgi:Kef-type K+ transport system membrane component KefB/Trk K+ transport system NAD-binding subunit